MQVPQFQDLCTLYQGGLYFLTGGAQMSASCKHNEFFMKAVLTERL
jgi:hypothetical protein